MKINGTFLVILHPDQNDFIELKTKKMDDIVTNLFAERAKQVAEEDKENVPPGGDVIDSNKKPKL